VKIVQRAKKGVIMQSQRIKVRSQRWRMKVKAMIKIPLNLWKT
jgi:hypothetical protein